MQKVITVYCVLWGDKYPHSYVQRLSRAVYANLNQAHRFVCITEQAVENVLCIKPPVDYPGWWQKIGLFAPGLNQGAALYIDLDCVISGPLDELVAEHTLGGLHMTRNWSPSAHGGWQSSVMLWRDDAGAELFKHFDPAIAHWPPRNAPGVLWGDQEYITERMGERVLEIPPGRVVSYKYHCQAGTPPPGASVVCFHGKPDYHEAGDLWTRQYIQTHT